MHKKACLIPGAANCKTLDLIVHKPSLIDCEIFLKYKIEKALTSLAAPMT